MSKTSIPISSVEESWIGFSLGLTLGNMDYSSRVGDITSSTGISTSNGRHSSRGKTSNASAGRGTDGSIASSGIRKTSIAIMSKTSIPVMSKTSIAVMSKTSIPISSVEESWIGFSLGLTLGNMDYSSRVGDITSSTGISTSNGRHSSRGKTSNASAGRGTDGSIASSGIRKTSIAIMSKTSIPVMSKTSIS